VKLSDYVVDVIHKEGVSHVFEFIGGAIAHLLDSISMREDIECVSVRHEQGGAFAAEAYARLNGKLGVAMATSGPGALNLVTGIGSCYFDSVPVLFITGQVNTYEFKFDLPVRQIGFQETDIVSVVKSLTKYAELVTDPLKIRYCLEKAIYMAQSGRPGPVLLDIPMNFQRSDINPEQLESFFDSEEYKELEKNTRLDSSIIENVKELLAAAKRPVILVGGGIRIAKAEKELRQLVEATGVPVVSSLMGLDVISHENPAFFGLIGSYGHRYSNMTLANCDLVLILGSRLDSRQTGTRADTFARAAKKIHVDIDPHEFNVKVKVDIAIKANVKDFLMLLNTSLEDFIKPNLTEWYQTINKLKGLFPSYSSEVDGKYVEPNRFMAQLSTKCKEGDVIVLDVGQHQMWAAQSFKLKTNQRMLNSGGMGAMGFALPASIGATLASSQTAIVIVGDGGIQVNIQELDTIVRLNLPVKIIVMNNNCLGMIRQFQDVYFNARQQSTVYKNPNFMEIAKAYGIPAFKIMNMENSEAILNEALAIQGPVFIEVNIKQNSEVHPKLVVNRPIEDMSPQLDREVLRQLMLIDLVEEMEVPK
jgi:acetolactate synthase-1/2/3 large subunit